MRSDNLQGAPKSALVVFDLDGTLLELSEEENDAYVQALEKALGGQINSDWSSYAVRTDLGVAREVLSVKYGELELESRISAFVRDYLELLDKVICSQNFEPLFIGGAREALRMLAHYDHIAIGLATANIRLAAEKRLKRAGILQYFHTCSYADNGRTKTDILDYAISKAKEDIPSLDQRRTVFVGDQAPDAIAATACSIEFLGIAKNDKQAEKLRGVGCSRFARDLEADGSFYAFLAECSIVA